MKTKEDLKPEENQELESTEGFFLKKIRTNEVNNEKDELENGQKKLKKRT